VGAVRWPYTKCIVESKRIYKTDLHNTKVLTIYFIHFILPFGKVAVFSVDACTMGTNWIVKEKWISSGFA
jgi:hypothetical protein